MSRADLCYPIVKGTKGCQYPDMERTYVKLKEGKYTGGNVFVIPKLFRKIMNLGIGLFHIVKTCKNGPLLIKFMMFSYRQNYNRNG